MIDIIKFRKDALIKKEIALKMKKINNHINLLKKKLKFQKKDSRMLELRNWLNLIN